MKYFVELYQLFLDMAPYLLFGLIFVGLLNVFVRKEHIYRYLGKKGFWPVFFASLFGVPMPLCSCGVVPTAVYMKKNGASGGAVASFLISTPQTGIDSIFATYGMLGWVFAIYRPISAFIMGIAGGGIYSALDKDSNDTPTDIDLAPKTCHSGSCSDDACSTSDHTHDGPVRKFFRYAFVEFLDDISIHFIVGLAIAALITLLIPDGYFSGLAIGGGVLGMVLVILLGVPMYICATASIPIAMTLMAKGFSPGIALVFLTVGPATNIATLTILLKVLGKRGTFLYLGILIVLAILSGLLFDGIHSIFNIDFITQTAMHSHGKILPEWLTYTASGLFGILMLASVFRKIKGKFTRSDTGETGEADTMKVIKIKGMNCNHCVANVEKAIEKVPGVETFTVFLDRGEAIIKGDFNIEQVIQNIKDSGYGAEVE